MAASNPLLTMRFNRQLVATGRDGFGYLSRPRLGPICHRLPPVATAGLHNGSILRRL